MLLLILIGYDMRIDTKALNLFLAEIVRAAIVGAVLCSRPLVLIGCGASEGAVMEAGLDLAMA